MARFSSALIPSVIQLDRSSRTPLQRQLSRALRDAIVEGRLKPGTRLPSTRELASELGVSRNCVVNAFHYLTAQGLLEGRSGAGTRVSPTIRLGSRIPPSTRTRPARSTLRMSRIITDVSSGSAGPFRPGVPAIDLFPTREWRALLSRHWQYTRDGTLAYDDGRGHAPLREAIAAHLGIARGVRCDPDQVIIVSGAQQSLDLTARVLLEQGDTACLEDPGYRGARAAFAAAGARIGSVPVDEEGIDVAEGRRRDPSPRLLYATPSHQYPTGVVMSARRRESVLAWALESGAWIVEDDFGGEFHHGAPAPAALQSMDRHDCVIYIGTFSQLLAPGLRIGYVIAPRDLVSAYVVARSIAGRGISAVEQAALADFMAGGGLARHVRRLRAAYLERQQTLVHCLRRDLPQVTRIGGTEAGTHLVAYLAPELDDQKASAAARAAGVEAPALSSFSASAPTPPALVLGYGSTVPEEIPEAVAILKMALTRVATRSK
jgi:GntR family transcriptional regulator/MocR family aminotransferase